MPATWGEGFDAAERAALAAIDHALHANGWAPHVSVERELHGWRELALEVDRYTASIDDYTNDLYTRDALEIALRICHGALQDKLSAHIRESDREFIARTEEDGGAAIGQYHRVDASRGWWWKRRPTGGRLGEYLEEG
jgi:hypothetical protein